MDRQLDMKASQMLKKSIEDKGIRIITEANTEELLGIDGHVTQLRLKDGTVLDADLVVLPSGFDQIKLWLNRLACAAIVEYW